MSILTRDEVLETLSGFVSDDDTPVRHRLAAAKMLMDHHRYSENDMDSEVRDKAKALVDGLTGVTAPPSATNAQPDTPKRKSAKSARFCGCGANTTDEKYKTCQRCRDKQAAYRHRKELEKLGAA